MVTPVELVPLSRVRQSACAVRAEGRVECQMDRLALTSGRVCLQCAELLQRSMISQSHEAAEGGRGLGNGNRLLRGGRWKSMHHPTAESGAYVLQGGRSPRRPRFVAIKV